MRTLAYGMLGLAMLLPLAMAVDCGRCIGRGWTPVEAWWGGYVCVEAKRNG
jgi:hypothetical protein